MSTTYGKWHGLAVEREMPNDPGSQLLYEFMHPGSCSWSIAWRSPWRYENDDEVHGGHFDRTYECDLGKQFREWGNEWMPTEPGLYWVRLEHYVSPSGPWGPSEYDVNTEWVPAAVPRFVPIPKPGVQVAPGEQPQS